MLAVKIGSRNIFHYENLLLSAQYIKNQFQEIGYTPQEHAYVTQGKVASNIAVEIKGKDPKKGIFVIGAHYDSVLYTPGADDNASGVAVLLELSRRFKHKSLKNTLRFVAFTNEEEPFFAATEMGSYVYAERCKAYNEDIKGMISLEMLGYYSNDPGSQKYPPFLSWYYPNVANFIGFVSNYASKELLLSLIEKFRRSSALPSEGIIASSFLPGVTFSDHWSFWENGFTAIMITDTAYLRNPNYHRRSDTIGTLDFENMVRLLKGLEISLELLVNT